MDDALNMLTRIYNETGNFPKAEECISKISADRYHSRVVGMVSMLGLKKCLTEQEQYAEDSLWKMYWTMSHIFELITHTFLYEKKDYEKALTFLNAHDKLLSVFDSGCGDFYVAYKITVCANKAHAYMKMGNQENCLSELKRFFVLAEQVKKVAESNNFNIAVRNPVNFSHIENEILEEYMPDIQPQIIFCEYDGFFGDSEEYLQFKNKMTI